MKDLFSAQADIYAKYRPVYPPELYAFIFDHVPGFGQVWDCGTGNGQVARVLSQKFNHVTGTDISEEQLSHAHKAKNISYLKTAEILTDIPDNTFDLVTVGTALHWFDFAPFYKEVNRVTKHNGIIAVWCYSLMKINPEIDVLLDEFCFKTMWEYWDKARKWVDEAYLTVPFPFKEISTPPFYIRDNWTIEHMEGYLNTWSSVQRYIKVHKKNPVDDFMPKIRALWKDTTPISFPVHARIGVIKKAV